MSDIEKYRAIIAVACVLLVVVIYFLGRPRKPDQGRRVDGKRAAGGRAEAGRSEPTLGQTLEDDLRNSAHGVGDRAEQAKLDSLERSLGDGGSDGGKPGPLRPSLINTQRPMQPSQPTLGVRREEPHERIVTLYVAARAGHQLNGPDLIVAAEKAGLVHGHLGIYHRLVDGRPELEPVFSVANMVKPGNFDLTHVQDIRTPGINFFITLPAPVSALDAWDAMLPTAQRMAELLDAMVLDEERNALGRQRIAHIRDELRAYDRQREQQTIRPNR